MGSSEQRIDVRRSRMPRAAAATIAAAAATATCALGACAPTPPSANPATSVASVFLPPAPPQPPAPPPPPPVLGEACRVNNRFACANASSALLCQNGAYVAMACRGPGGCQGVGFDAKCDDDLAQEGDTCQATLNENYSCSVDHRTELVCKNGKFVVDRTCKGPNECRVDGEHREITCDDSIGDLGDTCRPAPDDSNYACSTDKRIEIVCDAATRTFQLTNTCRGLKGCYIADQRVYCDQSLARLGDHCRPLDNHSCSEDGKVELKCMPGFTWELQRPCKHHGCRVKSSEVYCD
jgi:hypothetical protein